MDIGYATDRSGRIETQMLIISDPPLAYVPSQSAERAETDTCLKIHNPLLLEWIDGSLEPARCRHFHRSSHSTEG